jgi:hypothetical protein
MNTVFPSRNIEELSNEDLNIRALEQTLMHLKKSGKKIIFLKDVPTLPFNVRTCLPRSGKGVDWDPSSCIADYSSIEKDTSTFNKALDGLFSKFPDLFVIDLMDGVCSVEGCLGATKDRLLYLDDNHLSIYGSHYVIDILNTNFESSLGDG